MNPLLSLPRVDDTASLEVQVVQLKSCVYQLKEQIEILLQNVGKENLSSDVSGAIEEIGKLSVANNLKMGDNESKIIQTANAIKTEVKRATEAESTITQTATEISTRVSTAEDDISTLTQTATGLQTSVSNNSTAISTLNQRADGIEVNVTKAYTQYNTGNINITQTGSGIPDDSTAKSGAYYLDIDDGKVYRARYDSNYGWYWDYFTTCSQNTKPLGSQISALAGQVVLKTYEDSEGKTKIAEVRLDSGGSSGSDIEIAADNIDLNGYTRVNRSFSIDENGDMCINGDKFKVYTSTDSSSHGALAIEDVEISGRCAIFISASGIHLLIPNGSGGYLSQPFASFQYNSTSSTTISRQDFGHQNYLLRLNSNNTPQVRIGSSVQLMATQKWVEDNFVKQTT